MLFPAGQRQHYKIRVCTHSELICLTVGYANAFIPPPPHVNSPHPIPHQKKVYEFSHCPSFISGVKSPCFVFAQRLEERNDREGVLCQV